MYLDNLSDLVITADGSLQLVTLTHFDTHVDTNVADIYLMPAGAPPYHGCETPRAARMRLARG